jgi:hypothetical protein
MSDVTTDDDTIDVTATIVTVPDDGPGPDGPTWPIVDPDDDDLQIDPDA